MALNNQASDPIYQNKFDRVIACLADPRRTVEL